MTTAVMHKNSGAIGTSAH